MKIGVITYWAGNSNYGMMMQCWALQQHLKELGHEPYVIRFIKEDRQNPYKRIFVKLGVLNYISRIKCFFTRRKFINVNKNDKLRKFDSFRKTNISFSTNIYKNIFELQKNPPVADCYITGSDQVWSQLLDDYNNTAYYLNFGKEETLRISYAPSFSLTEYPFNLIDKLADALKKLHHISVREYDGVQICKNIGFEATKVLDPTLLLDKKDYLNLCNSIPRNNNEYIFIYSLNISSSNDLRWEELKEYSTDNNLSTIVTPSDGYFIGGEIFDDDVIYRYATIEEWLAMIRDSQLIVTSSFHGIVLSIILETPFVYVPLEGKFSSGNNRVIDLLRELNLEHRILSPKDTYSNLISNQIDWKLTKVLLNMNRNISMAYLKKSLS